MSRSFSGSGFITISLHFLGWCCFLLYPFIWLTLREDIILRVLFHTVLLAGFFYLNSFFLIPRFLTRGKFTVYFSIILLLILFIVFANLFFSSLINSGFYQAIEEAPRKYTAPFSDIRRIARPLFSSLFVFAASTSFKMLSEWYRKERKQREVENENLVSELSFLRSQVSPHFLFNTLNNIYSLSLSNSAKASASIMKLSQLLRYMLYESDVKQVFLDKEIGYLENYIDLQKIRLREDVQVSFVINGDPSGYKIEPMLLVPFVENAFKHGVNYSGKSDIHIELDVDNRTSRLSFTVKNFLHPPNEDTDGASGIGLNNVKRRLNLLYPSGHELKVGESEGKFMVELKLSLNK